MNIHLVKKYFSRLLAHSAWSGIAVIVALIAFLYPIMSGEKIEIINPRIENNTIKFALRNSTYKDIIIHNSKITISRILSDGNKCYSVIPIIYNFNLTINDEKYGVSGTTRNNNILNLKINEIIERYSIEVFYFKFDNIHIQYKNKCNKNSILVSIIMDYDDNHIIIGDFVINE